MLITGIIFFVGRDGAEIIAAMSISKEMFTVNTWGLSWGCVHPAWRHKGVMEQIGKICVEEIIKRIDVPSTVILASLKDKASFYRKMGFSGTTTDYEGGMILTKTVYPVVA